MQFPEDYMLDLEASLLGQMIGHKIRDPASQQVL
jgi:hypothetical protein